MLTVLCVRYGNKYGINYVERLRNMVSRNLTIPYEFACITDDQHPIDGVKTLFRPAHQYSKLWWHKVHMFDPSLGLEGRMLYFDLDVIIHDNINKLVENQENHFLGIRDFNRKFISKWDKLNSSVMSWMANSQNDIFHSFQKNPGYAMRLHGDQDWIYQCARGRIRYWPDAWIQSYKWEIRQRNEIDFRPGIRNFKTVRNPTIPKHCCVAVFHGEPNPDQVKDPFVVDNWR
jgi:hypothetical protein